MHGRALRTATLCAPRPPRPVLLRDVTARVAVRDEARARPRILAQFVAGVRPHGYAELGCT